MQFFAQTLAKSRFWVVFCELSTFPFLLCYSTCRKIMQSGANLHQTSDFGTKNQCSRRLRKPVRANVLLGMRNCLEEMWHRCISPICGKIALRGSRRQDDLFLLMAAGREKECRNEEDGDSWNFLHGKSILKKKSGSVAPACLVTFYTTASEGTLSSSSSYARSTR